MIQIDDDMLQVFRESPRCEYCGKSTRSGAQPHHMRCRGAGGGSRLDIKRNLMALCWQDHGLYHDGKISATELIAIIAVREHMTPSEWLGHINGLLREPKYMKVCRVCCGLFRQQDAELFCGECIANGSSASWRTLMWRAA